jgi:hypothetical protein
MILDSDVMTIELESGYLSRTSIEVVLFLSLRMCSEIEPHTDRSSLESYSASRAEEFGQPIPAWLPTDVM